MTPNYPELDETLRKIGRNVYLFQRMEWMLKFFIPRLNVGGSAETLRENFEKAESAVSRLTMGNLLEPFFETMYSEHIELDDLEEEITGFAMSFSFRAESTSDERARHQEALAKIVEERNRLIHSMLAKLKHDSPESCKALDAELDRQLELLRPEYYRLVAMGRNYVAAAKHAMEMLEAEQDARSE